MSFTTSQGLRQVYEGGGVTGKNLRHVNERAFVRHTGEEQNSLLIQYIKGEQRFVMDRTSVQACVCAMRDLKIKRRADVKALVLKSKL